MNNKKHVKPNIENIEYTKDAENIGIKSRFTKYEINEKAVCFKDLIKVKYNEYLQDKFRRNACYYQQVLCSVMSRVMGREHIRMI